ncbi:sulfate transporter family protein [Ancylobacter mangrovi]|uniref:Sulfate transporter family protein n=1 Tax=Ancylobacter mangrovi TaxID=2972472 RepID=A0A9X2PEV8_9HYPH|nr:sulfate transporter family protein [Ancylobacter mangrovi]MCS0494685.1 sulfate transporter family protein [Ancylobacter mangrovi]MCS0502080.1 sulfate transporter family protein [Ancylobacter mangrovi]
MLQDAVRSFVQTFSREYRRFLWRSIILAVGLLVALGIGSYYALTYFVSLQWDWANVTLDILAAVGIFAGAVFLVPPVTSLIAGLFVDEVAEQVEANEFNDIQVGRALPAGRALVLSLRFFGLTLAVNLVALLLLLVPGVNIVVFYVANGYLLGREYFQLAALRFRTEDEAALVRRHHGLAVFAAGMIIALVVSVPILNLITPIFATIFMVRLHKRLTRSRSYAAARRGSSPANGTGPK